MNSNGSFGPFTTRDFASPAIVTGFIAGGQLDIDYFGNPPTPFDVTVNYTKQGTVDLSNIESIDINNIDTISTNTTGSAIMTLTTSSGSAIQEISLPLNLNGIVTFLIANFKGIDFTRIISLSIDFHITGYTLFTRESFLTGPFTSVLGQPVISFPPNCLPKCLPNYYINCE